MNRRGFLAALAALPFVGKLVPKKSVCQQCGLPIARTLQDFDYTLNADGSAPESLYCLCFTAEAERSLQRALDLRQPCSWCENRGHREACGTDCPLNRESSWIRTYRRIHESPEGLPWRKG